MRWIRRLFFVSTVCVSSFFAMQNDAIQETLSRVFTSFAYAQDNNTYVPWGAVKILYDEVAIEEIPEDYSTQLLRRNASVTSKTYLPQDIIIGALENNNSKNAITQHVLTRIISFVRDIQQKKIHENLKEHVALDSMVIVSRQITRAREYATYIEDTRIGRINIGDRQERYAKIRILGRGKDFKSHAILRIYFQKEKKNVWKISAIEGNLDTLLNPYIPSGAFTPTGTLGITQTL